MVSDSTREERDKEPMGHTTRSQIEKDNSRGDRGV